ncbi:unnamed protein product, partial [Didymodactylos carnosus]
DFGEYTPINSFASNGENGLSMHNHFIELYQKTVYEMTMPDMIKHFKQFSLNLNSNLLGELHQESDNLHLNYQSNLIYYTRSGYTNSVVNSQLHWTGDASSDWNIYSGLPAHLQACLGLGISGVPYCSSPIGGYVCEFYSDLSTELLVRWLQIGTFAGFMHDETEGSACTQNRVQMFSNNETEFAWRKYSKLRTTLFPYIYTSAHEAHLNGLPLARHHLLSYFNDKTAIEQEYAFTFGNDFLVSPVVNQNQLLQNIYLPQNEKWIDISSNIQYDSETDGRFRIGLNQILSGGQWIMNVQADLFTIPLFIRVGSIIPLLDPSVFTLNPSNKSISLYNRSYVLHLGMIYKRSLYFQFI